LAGYTPTYATDRNGTANGALVFSGGQSLTLETSSLPGNSNQALGCDMRAGRTRRSRCARGGCSPRWAAARATARFFGNAGSGAGTLHAGLNTNAAVSHFGFDGNDVNGGSATLVTNVWYHIAFTYDTTASNGQRIYINGIPDVTHSPEPPARRERGNRPA
jgi:hypothetical protein